MSRRTQEALQGSNVVPPHGQGDRMVGSSARQMEREGDPAGHWQDCGLRPGMTGAIGRCRTGSRHACAVGRPWTSAWKAGRGGESRGPDHMQCGTSLRSRPGEARAGAEPQRQPGPCAQRAACPEGCGRGRQQALGYAKLETSDIGGKMPSGREALEHRAASRTECQCESGHGAAGA